MSTRYEMTMRRDDDGSVDTIRSDSLSGIKRAVDICMDGNVEFDVKDHEAASSFSSYRVIAAGRTTLSGSYVATADWLNDAFMAR